MQEPGGRHIVPPPAPLNILRLGGVRVPILFGNDLLWHDLPFSKGFRKFGKSNLFNKLVHVFARIYQYIAYRILYIYVNTCQGGKICPHPGPNRVNGFHNKAVFLSFFSFSLFSFFPVWTFRPAKGSEPGRRPPLPQSPLRSPGITKILTKVLSLSMERGKIFGQSCFTFYEK